MRYFDTSRALKGYSSLKEPIFFLHISQVFGIENMSAKGISLIHKINKVIASARNQPSVCFQRLGHAGAQLSIVK